jgi:hypothetical protein
MSLGTSLEDDPILKQSKQYTSQLNEARALLFPGLAHACDPRSRARRTTRRRC